MIANAAIFNSARCNRSTRSVLISSSTLQLRQLRHLFSHLQFLITPTDTRIYQSLLHTSISRHSSLKTTLPFGPCPTAFPGTPSPPTIETMAIFPSDSSPHPSSEADLSHQQPREAAKTNIPLTINHSHNLYFKHKSPDLHVSLLRGSTVSCFDLTTCTDLNISALRRAG